MGEGGTKYIVKKIFKDYNRAYGLSFTSLRYFNAAGADPDAEMGEDHNPENDDPVIAPPGLPSTHLWSAVDPVRVASEGAGDEDIRRTTTLNLSRIQHAIYKIKKGQQILAGLFC